MKKQLPKPENWQDFESLCKKLWGEVWKVDNKIKKKGSINIKIQPKIESRILTSEVGYLYEIKESETNTEEKIIYK